MMICLHIFLRLVQIPKFVLIIVIGRVCDAVTCPFSWNFRIKDPAHGRGSRMAIGEAYTHTVA